MENLRSPSDFIGLISFLGEDITPSISAKILDEAKRKLSKEQILLLGDSCLMMSAEAASLFTLISEYDGEMGGLSNY